MKVTLQEILPQAAQSSYAIGGFNIFSIDWARSVIEAAESLNTAVIIMTNKAMIQNLPPQYCGPILSDLAEKASVPVCVHLDHCNDEAIITQAIEYGFSSVMFDGSYYPLEKNIRLTKHFCDLAHAKNISIEGEVGTVEYTDNPDSSTEYTVPEHAEEFADKTKVDALAVSIGTIHRMEHKGATIQYDRIEEIERRVATPLVIHGTSGISDDDLRLLKTHRIAKFNIGTVLRLAFARQLRSTLAQDTQIFDKLEIVKAPYVAVMQETLRMIRLLKEDVPTKGEEL